MYSVLVFEQQEILAEQTGWKEIFSWNKSTKTKKQDKILLFIS
jgi:hypothetical protein